MAKKSKGTGKQRKKKRASAGRRRRSMRRALGVLFLRIAILGIIGLAGLSAYFYVQASSELEQWLQGINRPVNPSNIYAAPLVLRVGERIAPEQIIDYLRRASYVALGERRKREEGAYQLSDRELDIIPGQTAIVEGRRWFPTVRVRFDRRKHRIEQIIDVDRQRPVEQCQLEPLLISTITRPVGRPAAKAERGIRYPIKYHQMPSHLINAVVAVEDRTFFEHTGINPLAILRAFWHNLRRGETVEGGSTITQQLVKNILLGSERSYRRKLREAFLALALERRLSKPEIFTRYVNTIYMGHRGGLSIYGMGAAAREYFNKDISQIDLHEAALLAAMIHRPSYYLREEHRREALHRRNDVLDTMVRLGMITRQEAEKAKRAPLGLHFRPRPGDASIDTPYFVDYVQEVVARWLPGANLADGGYRIYTTLDVDVQRAAAIAMAEGLAVIDRVLRQRHRSTPPGTVQGALVAIEARSGHILAMVGGRSYSQSQFNRVTDAYRQPGSAIKPFVYAAALSSGFHEEHPITLATTYVDEPRTFEDGYTPENFGGKYLERPVTVREALVRSLNVVTMALAEDTGYGQIAGLIGRCGLPKPPVNPSIALGTAEVTPLELASAYTAFVRGGERSEPIAVQWIANEHGRVLRRLNSQHHRVMSPQVAYLVLSALQDVIRAPYGTAHAAAQLGDIPMAGKTGTSQRSDAWFVGLTPSLVTVTWVGFDDNTPLHLTGSRAALPIWISFMRRLERLRPDLLAGEFELPDGLIERPIDPTTGMLATIRCPEVRPEFFMEGREVTEFCRVHPGPPLEQQAPSVEGEPPPSRPEHRTRPRRVTRPDQPPGSSSSSSVDGRSGDVSVSSA